ncbi:MAG: CofH family radical SAM protein [Thermoleophilia bacterium]|jgi:aminodeoxyfutalosine synthase|nr:CofH family radical SAM protein [Thermoleophilia bacterium]
MIDRILQDAADGVRISPEQAAALYADAPLADLGAAADRVTRRRYGDEVTYNVNAHLNPTNICVVGCGFCAFAVWTEKDERAYAYSVDQLVDRARELSDLGITELHIVGGMTKEYTLAYYEDLFRELKATLPHVALTALTAVEIDFVARLAKVDHREALARTLAAGHDTMPGGGAEVFSPRVRAIIADRKVPAETWLAVHREAHRLGMRTNATLLFGHFETPEEKVEHMAALRDLQDEAAAQPGGFQAFIPLPFLPGNTEFAYLPGPSREEKLRTIAVARLFLDNFPHIKGHWVMLGEEVTSEALAFGLDDLSGTLTEERIAHATTVQTPLGLTQDRIGDLIRAGGRTPVERDTLYRPVDRDAVTA